MRMKFTTVRRCARAIPYDMRNEWNEIHLVFGRLDLFIDHDLHRTCRKRRRRNYTHRFVVIILEPVATLLAEKIVVPRLRVSRVNETSHRFVSVAPQSDLLTNLDRNSMFGRPI